MTSTTTINPLVQSACEIATGRVEGEPNAKAVRVVGAKKDLNCKGRGPQWYRLVLRNGEWQYVSSDRLPSGSFRAAERRAQVHGDAYHGELTITHDRGADVDDTAYLIVVDPSVEDGWYMVDCPVARTRAGLEITLPDGTIIRAANPRKR